MSSGGLALKLIPSRRVNCLGTVHVNTRTHKFVPHSSVNSSSFIQRSPPRFGPSNRFCTLLFTNSSTTDPCPFRRWCKAAKEAASCSPSNTMFRVFQRAILCPQCNLYDRLIAIAQDQWQLHHSKNFKRNADFQFTEEEFKKRRRGKSSNWPTKGSTKGKIWCWPKSVSLCTIIHFQETQNTSKILTWRI